MERKINKTVDQYFSKMKNDIHEKSQALGLKNELSNQLIQYIFDYDNLCLSKEDFLKRKRVKNIVPYIDRCCAKRANGEQCTRRKKEEYCGTHLKGTPYGIVDDSENVKVTNQKIEVWAQEIHGIIYYIDKTMNVYQAEDIVSNSKNPKIIAKYVKNGDVYSIPEFNLI